MEEKCLVKVNARGGAKGMHITSLRKVIERFGYILPLNDAVNIVNRKSVRIAFPSVSLWKDVEIIPLF